MVGLNPISFFSLLDTKNPERMNFGVLRVLMMTESRYGFWEASHDNMEIISFLSEGDWHHITGKSR
jgi:redox-sensitive bicupin YhaK (pirin superfamily)